MVLTFALSLHYILSPFGFSPPTCVYTRIRGWEDARCCCNWPMGYIPRAPPPFAPSYRKRDRYARFFPRDDAIAAASCVQCVSVLYMRQRVWFFFLSSVIYIEALALFVAESVCKVARRRGFVMDRIYICVLVLESRCHVDWVCELIARICARWIGCSIGSLARGVGGVSWHVSFWSI